MAALRAHPGAVFVQKTGFHALSILARDHGNKAAIAAAGGIEAAMAAMHAHPSEADVQGLGCHALTWLSAHHPGNKAAIAAAGGAEAVVAALRRHLGVAKVQENGCAALANLYSRVSPADRTAIAAAGCGEAIVAALRAHTSTAAVQKEGCRALGNFARACPDSRAAHRGSQHCHPTLSQHSILASGAQNMQYLCEVVVGAGRSYFSRASAARTMGRNRLLGGESLRPLFSVL